MRQWFRHTWPAAALGLAVLASGCTSVPEINASQPGPSPVVTHSPSPILDDVASPSPSPTPEPIVTITPEAPAEPATLDALALLTLAGVDPGTGNVVMGGFVAGIVESGGTCTYIVNRGDTEVARRSLSGTSNADSTSCGSTEVPAPEVGSGSFTVTLVYENSVGRTVSPAMTLEVPS